MITLQQLQTHLDELLDPGSFTDYCHNGLQVEGKAQIDKIATAVTASEAAIQAAVDAKADALIVHHGLFWDRQPVRLTGGMRRRVALLLEHEISLLAYHLPLDAHPEVGNNWSAARDLGLTELTPFGTQGAISLGVQGEFAPIKVSEWIRQLEEYYTAEARVALGGPDEVRTVAIVSGGAHGWIDQAIESGVDCYVTGTCDEPLWHKAHEEGIHFIALGHSATERIGPKKIGDHLGQHFQIAAEFLDLNNPF
jgi:dinuclear metal center YbgI/SA1388 family protein